MADPTAVNPPPPIQVLQMMMGHWVAQITAAVARFEVPDQLAKGPKSAEELARACQANRDAMERLLRAATMVGLLREEGGRYTNSPTGECLRSGTPGSVRDLVIAELAPGHWLPWGKLYDAVKSGQPTCRATLGMDLWDYYAKNTEEGTCFARGMGNVSAMAVQEVLASSFDWRRFTHVVDVGGSQGVMLQGILHAVPQAKGILFDRPDVIEAGRSAVNGYGLGDRLSQVAGDFFQEVPAGGDLYVMKLIIHDWDDAHCTTILKNVHRAAKPGAHLAIVEMVRPDQVAPAPVFLMDLNMLVMLGGRERSEAELRALLAGAGWKLTRVVPTAGLSSVVEAQRV
jgi:hypothetical protein